ncbi:MAG: GntR family transcriptional regulator [Microbacterium sp.]
MRPLSDGRSLLDRVTDSVRTAILDGELVPGSHVSVPEIARQLNVSRTPAREALLRLQHEGLVRVTPRRGAVVLDASVADLRALFHYREALEGMAARSAATEMTPRAKRALREIFIAHRDAVESQDVAAHEKHDRAFHIAFIEGSGNRYIIGELDRVRSLLQLLMREMAAQPGALSEPLIHAHERLLVAIEEGDGDAAERAARKHVRAILEFSLAHPDADIRPLPAAGR